MKQASAAIEVRRAVLFQRVDKSAVVNATHRNMVAPNHGLSQRSSTPRLAVAAHRKKAGITAASMDVPAKIAAFLTPVTQSRTSPDMLVPTVVSSSTDHKLKAEVTVRFSLSNVRNARKSATWEM